jgi:glucose/arabinose dehydrogenase
MRRALLLILLLALLPSTARADTLEANGMRLVKIVDSNFAAPVHVAAPTGDDRRVFVVEQGSGTTAAIQVVRDGVKLSPAFLELTGVKTGGEQGLLSMAFAPDYATSGRFYVYYTSSTECTGDNCDIAVDEFRRLDDDHADPATRRRVFTVAHRDAGNHNGGQLQFGPDGLLYAGPGDGGTQDDPECDAQRTNSNLGKILRIDPRAPGASPQIYALGLRNPFRFSFDRFTGDLLIGDVGGGVQEEIDFLAAGAPAGAANFGWNRFEGAAERLHNCVDPVPPGYVAPAIHYDHASGSTAVTGGYVVRDTSMAPLLGRYVYADFFVGEIRSAVVGPSSQLGDGPAGLQVDNLSSFGQDGRCRIYVTSLNGPVYRLEAVAPAGSPACQTLPVPPAPPLPVEADRTAPALSRVRVSRSRFRVSSDATPRVARTPAGTVVRYTLSERSEVSLRFYRALAGRRSGRGCVAPTRRRRRAAKCTRYPLRGTVVRQRVEAGRRFIRFTGRVGVRALPPGRYRAILRARDAAGNVSPGRVLVLRLVTR